MWTGSGSWRKIVYRFPPGLVTPEWLGPAGSEDRELIARVVNQLRLPAALGDDVLSLWLQILGDADLSVAAYAIWWQAEAPPVVRGREAVDVVAAQFAPLEKLDGLLSEGNPDTGAPQARTRLARIAAKFLDETDARRVTAVLQGRVSGWSRSRDSVPVTAGNDASENFR